MPPIREPDGQLSDVSCAGAMCMAVGATDHIVSSDPYPENAPLAEEHTSSGWGIIPALSPTQGGDAMQHVSCSSAQACIAIGTATWRWNGGSRWVVAATGAGTPAELDGIACLSSSDCFGVGGGYSPGAIVERWNGQAWTAQSTPSTPNGAQLDRISCTSATSCLAVGEVPTGSNNTPELLAERLSGGAWTISSPVTPAGAVAAAFSSVSCAPSGTCMAVGWSATSLANGNSAVTALAERFADGGWKLEPVPAPSGHPNFSLESVSCPAWSACVALGPPDGPHTVSGTFVSERWNGSSWSPTAAPPSVPEEAILGALACSSVTDCTAVSTGWSHQLPLADGWNGSDWQSESVPAPMTAQDELSLNGVSCPRTTLCVAVGDGPSVAIWRGTRWQPALPPVPLAAHTQASLSSVSCASDTSCMAVGTMTLSRTGGQAPFSESWNGTTWRVQAVPTPAGDGSLSSVSCWAPNGCTAIGSGLIEMWNGSAWSIATAPPSQSGETLNSVSCASASFCLGVGDDSHENAFVERWDGSAWSLAPAPVISGQYNAADLIGVSCRSSSFCEAIGVGDSVGGYDDFGTTWAGRGWTAIQYRDGGNGGGGISCPGTSECLTAETASLPGVYRPGGILGLWNGMAWSSSPTPTEPWVSYLNGISCSGALACTAVGNQQPASNVPGAPFVVRYALASS